MERVLSIVVCTFFFMSLSSVATAQDYYWVSFTDKQGTPFRIDRPDAFLSPKAIERRERFEIPITEEDLPVSPVYTDSLRSMGIHVQHTSKWLNAATIISETNHISDIQALSFVDTVFFVGQYHAKVKTNTMSVFKDSLRTKKIKGSPYGYSKAPLKMLKGDFLHQQNFKGQDQLIAVLDGGFYQVDVIPFFDSLRTNERLVSQYDFVDNDTTVFESSSHGTKVLSTMAANVPELMIGTAPLAQYSLIKTEDVRSEFPAEECHWIAGLEYADSLGANISTTSLGYTTFSKADLNYKYSDLNGTKALASIAAEKAYVRGMLLLVSAGNEGNSKWKHITVPADSKYVLAIGATDIKGRKALFSSFGPAADGRIKPDIAGPGIRMPVSSVNTFRVSNSNGTSISTPIIAGLTACLWQAFPHKTNAEIMNAIRQSANQSNEPDNELGYGIPDFQKAYELLSQKDVLKN